LDELILERFAIAARSLAQPGRPQLTNPSLVELVLGDRATAEDRTRALVLLGLDVTRPVRVVAIDVEGRDAPETVALGILTLAGLVARSRTAVVGGVTAAILQPRQEIKAVVSSLRDTLPLADTAVRVGVGDAVDGLDARRSWQQAMVAHRFADAITEPLVVHETLGTLALLAEIDEDRLGADRDVRALCELAHTRSGAEDIAALEAFCRAGSLRQAARVLHRHHSSVASRLSHVEDAMGWDLDDPADRFRARLTLLARRLVDKLPG
jgi:sugar diacid utilization regulator